MDKVFEHLDDLHVAARKAYVKTGDAYAYADSGKTKKIDAATLSDMYMKGMLIVDGDNLYKPVKLVTASGVVTITYVTTDATTVTTAKLATLKSA